MLGDAICWAIALVLMFTQSTGFASDLSKMWLAVGFIFVGSISRFVSTYRTVNSKKEEIDKAAQ